MKDFFRISTRLNCDIFAAYRFFTNPVKINKWTSVDENFRMGIGNPYTINPFRDEISSIGTSVTDFETNQYISLNWHDSKFFRSENSKQCKVEIYFMKCTSNTEYCTEIQILVSGWKRYEWDAELFEAYKEYFQNWIEELRKTVNGKWVIQDRDLNLKELRGSTF